MAKPGCQRPVQVEWHNAKSKLYNIKWSESNYLSLSKPGLNSSMFLSLMSPADLTFDFFLNKIFSVAQIAAVRVGGFRSRQRGFRPFRGHGLQRSHQLCTQHEMLWSPKYYPSTLSHCIHSLYFSAGIKQHRCRLPGVSTLELTPFGTSEFRLEQGGWEGEYRGFCPRGCACVRGTIRVIDNMRMCANNTYAEQGK